MLTLNGLYNFPSYLSHIIVHNLRHKAKSKSFMIVQGSTLQYILLIADPNQFTLDLDGTFCHTQSISKLKSMLYKFRGFFIGAILRRQFSLQISSRIWIRQNNRNPRTKTYPDLPQWNLRDSLTRKK